MSNTYRVFYFEDDETVANPLTAFLEKPVHGPTLKVIHHADATRAKIAIDQWSDPHPPHVVLLDRHQNGYTNAGIDICKKVKTKWPSTPVVFLSDLAGIHEQIEGFEVQANVYLPKAALLNEPDHKELIQKVLLAQIIRDPEPNPSEYMNGSLRVNKGRPALWWRDKELNLSPDNIAIVDELASLKKRGDTRMYMDLAIAGDLRGDDAYLRDNLRKHIQNIRRAFQEVDEDFTQACKDKRHGIIAVPQRGYKWVTDILSEAADE